MRLPRWRDGIEPKLPPRVVETNPGDDPFSDQARDRPDRGLLAGVVMLDLLERGTERDARFARHDLSERARGVSKVNYILDSLGGLSYD